MHRELLAERRQRAGIGRSIRAPPARRSCRGPARARCGRSRRRRPAPTESRSRGAAPCSRRCVAIRCGQLLARPCRRCRDTARPAAPRRRRRRRARVRPTVAHEGLELLVAGDEIGLGVDLDDGAARRRRQRRRPALRRRRGRPSSPPPPGPSCAASRPRPPCRRRSRSSALLQSIIPAPVLSRSSLTSAAVISAMLVLVPSSSAISSRPSRACSWRPASGSGLARRLVARLGGTGFRRRRTVAGTRRRPRPPASSSADGASRAPISTPWATISACRPSSTAPRHEIAIELDRAQRVVVARDRKGDAVGSRVGIEDRDDRDAQLAAPPATAIASLLVSITNRMSGRPPMSLMPPSARSSLSRSRVRLQQLLLRQARACSLAELLVELAQPLDRAARSSASWSACRRASGG